MSPAVILLIAGGMAFITALVLLYYSIRYSDDDTGVVLGLISAVFAVVTATCMTQAVKEAKIQNGTAVEEKKK